VHRVLVVSVNRFSLAKEQTMQKKPKQKWPPKPVRPPGRELFFKPLEAVFDQNNRECVNYAYRLSKLSSHGKFREDGTRVFDHPKAAAWIYINELGGRDPDIIIIILWHDVLEDTEHDFLFILSPFRIRINTSEEIALDIGAVSKLKEGKETIRQYLLRVIGRGPRTILAKLCDRLHNIRNLHWSSSEKRKCQIAETQRYHLPLLVPALRAYGGQWAIYADALEQKIKDAIVQYK